MSDEVLKEYAREFRSSRYRPEVNRSLFHFFKFLTLALIFTAAQYILLKSDLTGFTYVAIALVISFFQGLTYLSLWRDHFAHHINPYIPHYKLKEATEFIGASHPNNRLVRGSFLR